MDSVIDSALELMRRCVVKVDGTGSGSGFFVAPGRVVTCAHVSGAVGTRVTVGWHGTDQDGVVRWASPRPDRPGLAPYPDLAVIAVAPPVGGHPVVWLDDHLPLISSDLIAVGHSRMYGPEPARTAVRFTGGGDYEDMIQLGGGEVAPGLSGGPVLNADTGGVCAIVKATRQANHPSGGVAVPVRALRRVLDQGAYRKLFHDHDAYHRRNRLWIRLLDGLPESVEGVTRRAERELRAILAKLPGADPYRHLADYRAVAGPLAGEPRHPLYDHGDVVTELAGFLPAPNGFPHVLSYAINLSFTVVDGSAADSLRLWATMSAQTTQDRDEVARRLDEGGRYPATSPPAASAPAPAFPVPGPALAPVGGSGWDGPSGAARTAWGSTPDPAVRVVPGGDSGSDSAVQVVPGVDSGLARDLVSTPDAVPVPDAVPIPDAGCDPGAGPAAPLDAIPSVMVCVRPAGNDRKRYRCSIWRYMNSTDIVPIPTQNRAVPLEDLWRRLREWLPGLVRATSDDRGTAMIELIVPQELMDEEIDHWPEDPDRALWSAFGQTCPVVVRELERFDESDEGRLRPWRWRWDALDSRDVSEALLAVSCRESRSHQALRSWLELNNGRGVLVLPGSPKAPPARTALEVGLYCGVPIMVWRRDGCAGEPDVSHRDCPGSLLRQAVREELRSAGRHDVPERVKTMRNKAGSYNEPECGHQVVLLWDDPSRRPPRPPMVPPRRGQRARG